MTTLEAIKYQRGSLKVLDQLLLPHQTKYDEIKTCEEAFDSIKSMRVRGAPAIAIVAALALTIELVNHDFFEKPFNQLSIKQQVTYIFDRLNYLKKSRPTAVDLSNAIKLLKKNVQAAAVGQKKNVQEVYITTAEKILEDDYRTNLAISRYGAEYLRSHQSPLSTLPTPDDPKYFTTSPPGTQGAPDKSYRKLSVLTHCNTGSLATSGHGTALGIIRSLHKMNYLDHAYCTETRPYNQGSRLTAYELVYENIPSTLITDSMAGALFSRMKTEKNIAAVIVGADRVARNGDTANKIGTYSLAVLAKYHNIKFIVAAPCTTIDLETATGVQITIEDRASTELTQVGGAVVNKDGNVDVSRTEKVVIAHQGIRVWNPSFDVTPAALIDAIITERGEIEKDDMGRFDFWRILPERWATDVGPLGSNGMPLQLNGNDNANLVSDNQNRNENGTGKGQIRAVMKENLGSDESGNSKTSDETVGSKDTKSSDESTQFKMEDIS